MSCPAEGCTREIELDRFACGYHWRILPHRIKAKVWARWDGRLVIDYDVLVAEANAEWAKR